MTIRLGSSSDGMSSCLRFVRASPPNTAATIVISAISARFLRLRTASFDKAGFSLGRIRQKQQKQQKQQQQKQRRWMRERTPERGSGSRRGRRG